MSLEVQKVRFIKPYYYAKAAKIKLEWINELMN